LLVALTVGPGLVIPPYEAAVDPVAVPAVRVTIAVAFVLTVGGLAVGAWSLAVRFRHAGGIEREQLRWIAFAGALTGVAAAVVLVGMALGATAVLLLAAGVCLAILPLATGAAILRYRLYDLDRILSRTLAYALLALLLAGGYAVMALALGQLLGQDSSLVVAGAPWPSRSCSSGPAAASSRRSTGATTAAATTPPRRSRPSAPASATRSTSTP
jgi:hypothetical protein